MPNIINYIPVGKENAISVQHLQMRTGLSNREIRKVIQKASRNFPICNNQDGNGYYIPSSKDVPEVSSYLKQEKNRAMSILYRLKGVKDFLRHHQAV